MLPGKKKRKRKLCYFIYKILFPFFIRINQNTEILILSPFLTTFFFYIISNPLTMILIYKSLYPLNSRLNWNDGYNSVTWIKYTFNLLKSLLLQISIFSLLIFVRYIFAANICDGSSIMLSIIIFLFFLFFLLNKNMALTPELVIYLSSFYIIFFLSING